MVSATPMAETGCARSATRSSSLPDLVEPARGKVEVAQPNLAPPGLSRGASSTTNSHGNCCLPRRIKERHLHDPCRYLLADSFNSDFHLQSGAELGVGGFDAGQGDHFFQNW